MCTDDGYLTTRAGQHEAAQDVYARYAMELRERLSARLGSGVTDPTRQLFEEAMARLCRLGCARCSWRDLRDWLLCESWEAQYDYDASAPIRRQACSEILTLMGQIEIGITVQQK